MATDKKELPDLYSIALSQVNLMTDDEAGRLLKLALNYINEGDADTEETMVIIAFIQLKKILDYYIEEEITFVYVVKLLNDHEEFIKIGISRDPDSRYEAYNQAGYSFEEITKRQFSTRSSALEMESDTHKRLKDYKYEPAISFAGHTECFHACVIQIMEGSVS